MGLCDFLTPGLRRLAAGSDRRLSHGDQARKTRHTDFSTALTRFKLVSVFGNEMCVKLATRCPTMEAAGVKEVGGLSLQQLLGPVCCTAAPCFIFISISISVTFRGFLRTLRGGSLQVHRLSGIFQSPDLKST